MSFADNVTRVATGLTVAGLAGVAGAISFSHMSALAADHGQTGWKSVAFPISVDGLELVASLFLVSQRRAGRRPGWLPWTALTVGTAASLAANVAVGGHDPIGRALAGWPAISLLVSIKLLFSMFDHGEEHRPSDRDDQRTVADGPAAPGTLPGDGRPSGAVRTPGTVGPMPSVSGTDRALGAPDDAAPIDMGAVADLLPAAHAAHIALIANGRALSREALTDQMRANGFAVSNARASVPVKILKADRTTGTDREDVRAAERDDGRTEQAA